MNLRVYVLALVMCCLSCTQIGASPLSWDTMRKYFMYSLASYCPAEQGLSNWTCGWCNFVPIPSLTNITVFETPGYGMGRIYGYIGLSNESIIVAFRGSATTSNWIVDFEFTHTPYPIVPGAFVHDGFYKGYLQVADIVYHTVYPLQVANPNLTVISTGHSLGGALALLNAVGLVQSGIKNVQLWDYGQPRVGNDVFANYTKELLPVLYRVINQDDIVPHLPPMDVGYHHPPTEIWFPTNYTYYEICDQSGEDPNCSDSVPMTQLSPKDHVTYLGYGANGLQPAIPCL